MKNFIPKPKFDVGDLVYTKSFLKSNKIYSIYLTKEGIKYRLRNNITKHFTEDTITKFFFPGDKILLNTKKVSIISTISTKNTQHLITKYGIISSKEVESLVDWNPTFSIDQEVLLRGSSVRIIGIIKTTHSYSYSYEVVFNNTSEKYWCEEWELRSKK